jgi:hypothetical protein
MNTKLWNPQDKYATLDCTKLKYEASLSKLAFDIASLRQIRARLEEIDALEEIWRYLWQEYKNNHPISNQF